MHEGDLFIAHNALVLMTTKETPTPFSTPIDLQIHTLSVFVIMASQRCIFEALAKFITLLFKLYQGNPTHLSRTPGKRKIRIFQGTERYRWKN